MLSKTCKIAIKAVIYLCSKFETGENASIKEVAAFINASEHTIGKVLQILVRQYIIKSAKGPSGGFFITEAQQAQPIINIVEAVDGKELFTGCGLGLSKCSASHPCPIHDEYKEAREIIEKLFRKKKVIDLTLPITHGMAYLIG